MAGEIPRCLFTLNFHGRRANHERLERRGSGYVGRHAPDFLVDADPWFRGIGLSFGPDGTMYVLDWSDTGECHNGAGVSRASGRIHRIFPRGIGGILAARVPDLPGAEVADLAVGRDPWRARQARLELTRRAAVGVARGEELLALRQTLSAAGDVRRRLRALWALHGIGAADITLLRGLLRNEDERVRTWAIRLLTDTWPLDTVMSERPAR